MRQVILVLIALLAVSIFMPAILAKQGNTAPSLVSSTNMSKYTAPKSDPDTSIFGITSTMSQFLNGTFAPSTANYKDVISNNNAARWDILNFLNPDYNPAIDNIPAPTPLYKMHQLN